MPIPKLGQANYVITWWIKTYPPQQKFLGLLKQIEQICSKMNGML